MGRSWIAALLVVVLGSHALAADDDFAVQEWDRYIAQMTPGDAPKLKLEVKVDPNLNREKETYSFHPTGTGFTVIGTNKNIALTGVYHLLDHAGCRFLAPNFDHYKGSAEYVPSKMSPMAFSGSMMWSPQLKFRKLYVEEGHSHDIENLKQLAEWMPKVGYNTLVVPTDYQGSGRVKWDNWRKELTPELQKRGIIIEVGGHGYQNFLNAEMEGGKLFDEHPDWFGKDASGKPQRVKGRVICTSNADAVAYLIKNFVAYVQERPEIQIYDFWPPDGAKWCECEKCTAMGTPSDRQAILVARVKEAARKVRPDLRLEVLAYHTSLLPPEKAKLDPEVLLDFCPISQQFDVQINDPSSPKNKEYVDGVTAWRKAFAGDISIYTYYRKYAWDSLPVIIPHYMQKDLQWYATLPVQGVSVYSEPADWFTYELNHYVLAALAWNANADVDALIKKFCDARYGEESIVAIDAMKSLEQTTHVFCSVPNVPLKDETSIKMVWAGAEADLQSLVKWQERTADPAIKRNINRLCLMFTYAIKDLEIQHLRASKAPEAEIRAKAADLLAWIKSHENDGVFLVKDQRLAQNRVNARYGLGKGG